VSGVLLTAAMTARDRRKEYGSLAETFRAAGPNRPEKKKKRR
jgi:hypothetical protein